MVLKYWQSPHLCISIATASNKTALQPNLKTKNGFLHKIIFVILWQTDKNIWLETKLYRLPCIQQDKNHTKWKSVVRKKDKPGKTESGHLYISYCMINKIWNIYSTTSRLSNTGFPLYALHIWLTVFLYNV